MKVRYTEFALDPNLRGTTIHLPAHRAQALIDIGAAVEVPYKNFQERLAAEMPPPVAPVVQWAVHEKASGGAIITKTINGGGGGGEVSHYNTPPVDCPQDVVARFKHISRLAVEYGSGAAEKERLEREQYSLKEKVAVGIARLIYGSKDEQ
jgi:hypothetical protein